MVDHKHCPVRAGVLCVALAACVFAFSNQSYGEERAAQHDQNQTVPAVPKPTAATPHPQHPAKRCPGSYHPEIDCAAISANAAVDQVRNAENQTWWFRWEVLLTFLTLVVAGFAMNFARLAARHTEAGAKATKATADLAIAQSEPRVSIECGLDVQPRGPDNVTQVLALGAVNNGHTEALGFRFFDVRLSVEGSFDRLPLTAEANVPGVADLPHAGGGGHGFCFPIPLDRLNNVEARKGLYTGKTVKVELAYSYKTVLGKEYGDRGVWSGTFKEHRNPNADNAIQDVTARPVRVA